MFTQYEFLGEERIIRDSDGAYIPPDPANSDYQLFLLWQSEQAVATGE